MAVEIGQVTEVSEALVEAFERLMPQLSPRLGALSREALRRVVENERTVLLAAVADGRIAGVLTLAWYDAPSGRRAGQPGRSTVKSDSKRRKPRFLP